MNDEIYALLWSKKSNGFHTEPLSRTAQSGMRFFEGNMTNDYLLIAFGTDDEVSAKADELRPLLVERAEVRRLYDSGKDDNTV
ncbi:hypothetical protein [Variovorax sp. RA8]|uniref:hypothetical protein n=1 Tax=Variovorax sp. (strain JCM 16519 / RA8) TaxID=662548 RepID=UPI000B0DD79D|nr:hypothetical protein [Variovorax sp. RA8]VTU34218.1 hypothetical protein RA8CHR_04929 [Variovorax sp. RA8]